MLWILRMPPPRVGNGDAADKTDCAVHDQQLAVRAVVHPAQRVQARRVAAPHFDACRLPIFQLQVFDSFAASPVEHHMRANLGAGALD